jgi:hypothetical protein
MLNLYGTERSGWHAYCLGELLHLHALFLLPDGLRRPGHRHSFNRRQRDSQSATEAPATTPARTEFDNNPTQKIVDASESDLEKNIPIFVTSQT